MYILNNGVETTAEEITAAHKNGMTRLVHSHGDGKTLTSISIDGVDIDTRRECHSVWDEVWTTIPKSLNEAIKYARY